MNEVRGLSGPIITGVGSACPGVSGDPAKLDKILSGLVADGATNAEIALVNLDVVINGAIDPVRLADIKAVCDNHPLTYSIHGAVATNLMDEPNMARLGQVLAATIDLCSALGGSLVVVHPGRVRVAAIPDMERLLALERTAVLAAAGRAHDLGVKIGLENISPDTSIITGQITCYALDPRRLAAQISAICHPAVCGVIDVGHAYLASLFVGYDLAEALAPLASLTNHLHLQDGFGQPVTVVGANEPEQLAYGQGDMHLPLGWGDLDLAGVLAGLPVMPDTRMVIELAPRYMRYIGDSITTAREIAAAMNAAAEAGASD